MSDAAEHFVHLLDPDDRIETRGAQAPAVPDVTFDGTPIFTPHPGQVIDIGIPDLVFRYGDVEFPAALALAALARVGKHQQGMLPQIGDVASEAEYLAAIGDQGTALWTGTLPLMDEQIWGYHRWESEDVIPDTIPILADIGELKALPTIIDPVLHRVFTDAARHGPRLLACTAAGTPMPNRCYVAEFPPTSVMSRVGDTMYQLNTPYVIAAYIPAFGTLFLRCRTRPVVPGDTETSYFPFPHISATGQVCLQVPHVNELRKAEPLEAITAAMTAYWHTGYAYYLCTNGLDAIPGAGNHVGHGYGNQDVVANFKWWERQSFETILGLAYRRAETVEEFARSVFATRVGGRERGGEPRYRLEFFIDPTIIAQTDQKALETEAALEAMVAHAP